MFAADLTTPPDTLNSGNRYTVHFFRFMDTVVKIEILDVNDCPPIFERTKYYKNLSYDAKVNTPVVKVKVSTIFINNSFISIMKIFDGFTSCNLLTLIMVAKNISMLQ